MRPAKRKGIRLSSLLGQSLLHFWRQHLGVLLGTLVASITLTGALLVGESVRGHLRDKARLRIGGADAALLAHERYFQDDLGARLRKVLPACEVSTILRLQGIGRRPDGQGSSQRVTALGVTPDFFRLAPDPEASAPQIDPGKAFLNASLAEELQLGIGDSVVLRIEKPSSLPRDMAMATIDDISLAIRVEVQGLLEAGRFGQFQLRSEQTAPHLAFVDRSWLQQETRLTGKANAVLLGRAESAAITTDAAQDALRRVLELRDAELRFVPTADEAVFELRSDRIFLDRAIVAALREAHPDLGGVLTYFVTGIRKGDAMTPYSMVTGLGPLDPGASLTPAVAKAWQGLPATSDPPQLLLNQWCAEDLGAGAGDELRLEYFVMDAELNLRKEQHAVTVARVIPMSSTLLDKQLMPDFPGIAESDDCRDWTPGIAIDLEQIRDKDEKYWDAHRGTPKGLISLGASQQLWSNRFGNLTAVRGPVSRKEALLETIPGKVDPRQLGLAFRDLRAGSRVTATATTDFGGLFLGLSFFLIGAALLLATLLFSFGIQQRCPEAGTLLALGWRPRQVRRRFLLEAGCVALLGGVLGALAGGEYARAVLYGLNTLWSDAVGQAQLRFVQSPTQLALGAVSTTAVAVLSILWTLRRVLRASPLTLLRSRQGLQPAQESARPGKLSLASIYLCLALAIALVLATAGSPQQSAAFFAAGALCLTAGLLAVRRRLLRPELPEPPRQLGALAQRNSSRRAGRSLATVALLASGTFLVVAVSAHRLSPPPDPGLRPSGTGGYRFVAQASIPIMRDLDSEEGQTALGLDPELLEGSSVLPIRVKEGDDASCLNLSRPQQPRLLGVPAAQLSARGSFRFAGAVSTAAVAEPDWKLLDQDFGADVVPAIGDAASVTWAMHKALGEDIEYQDEQGRPFRVRIVATLSNSILQGSLLISEQQLQRRFPGASGYRMFLIDTPAAKAEQVAQELSEGLLDLGFTLTTTAEQLRAFMSVQNTYLLIFQALGAIGLLLGSIGMGIVVLRNALERRSELALLRALGFRRRRIRSLLQKEHLGLLLFGLAIGTASAVLGIAPDVLELDVGHLLLLLAGIFVNGWLWIQLACWFSTRSDLLPALRDE